MEVVAAGVRLQRGGGTKRVGDGEDEEARQCAGEAREDEKEARWCAGKPMKMVTYSGRPDQG